MQVAEPQGTIPTALSGEIAVEPSRRRALPQFRIAYASDVAAISLLLALVALVSWDRLWSASAFFDGDVRSFFIPFFAYMGEHIRHHDVPGWMPQILSGMPFAADPESGWGYLPAMIPFAILPPLLAYKVFFISQLLLAAISTYLLARLLGFHALGSFAAAAVWTFGPSVGVAGCCTIFSEFAAWIPVALVGVELISRAGRWSTRLCWIVFTGVAISQILSGWVGQGSYYGLLTVGSYFVFRGILVYPRKGRALLDRTIDTGINGALSFAFGFGFGAAALLPRLDNVPLTHLGSSEYRETTSCEPNCGLTWYVLLKTLVSRMDYWYPYYIGGAVLACATIGVLELSRRRELFYFAGLAAVIFILAMNTGTIHSVFYALPEFEGLHKHVTLRVFILLPLPIAMFVAAAVDGFDRIVRQKWALGLPLVARFVWWAAVLAVPVASLEVAPFTRYAYLLSWIVIVAGILLARNWTRLHLTWLLKAERALPVALVLLVLWDPTGRSVIEDLTNPDKTNQSREVLEVSNSSTDPGGAGAFLQEQRDAGEWFRYFGYAPPGFSWQAELQIPLLMGNRAVPLGLEDIQGYNPGQIERYRLFFEALNQKERNYHSDFVLYPGLFSPLIDLLNVRYIVVPNYDVTNPPHYDLFLLNANYNQVFQNDEVRVLENPNALPRAWMVHTVSQVSSSGARNRLARGRIDPREKALVEGEPPRVQQLPTGAADVVTITGYDDDSIALAADAKADGFLVLSEIYNPGWSVKVDGEPAKLYETDYLLRGVAVPEGNHEIVFTYQPKSLKYGLYITLTTTLVAVIVLILACVRLGRRRGSDAGR